MITMEQKTFVKGDTLYWRKEPKAKFKFVKMNKDGSVGLFGGEPGYGMYRDARVDDVSEHPFEGLDQLLHWAGNNLFAEITVPELAALFTLNEPAVRKYVTGRPDVFRRVGHGKYEIRDPKADREKDKNEN